MVETETPRTGGLVARVPAWKLWRRCEQRQKRWRWLLFREHQEPPVSVLDPIEDPAEDKIGVCCSGGGMRSASFNLGALQAIQDAQRLQHVRYLAAVSGGSYIAAAFAMVAKTRDAKDTRDTEGDESDARLVTPENPPFAPGSPEEQYLRNRASYLAPTGADKAYLVWRVLLGLLVNLLLIATVITLAAAILAPYYRNQHSGLMRPPPPHVLVGASPNGWVWGLGLSLCLAGVLMGGAAILMRPRGGFLAGVRRALEVWSLPVFVLGVAIFALEVLVPTLIDVLRKDSVPDQVQATNKVAAGLSASVAAIVGAIVLQLRAAVADPLKTIKETDSTLKKLSPRVRLLVIYIATYLLGPLLIFAMFVAAIMIQVEDTRWETRVFVPLGAFLIFFAFMRFGDLTSWSLHPFYRRRLATAFALRRIWREGDPDAGHAVQRRDPLVPLSATRVRPETPPYETDQWPTLLVCAAANVSDPGASPPGRGVTSFTFAADEMGGPLVGGVPTQVFENALSAGRQRDFTLPAVVAMSGAAISPSMGKMTRASVRFLMGMANVRLGVWLPNPRRMESFVRVRTTLRQDVATGLMEKIRAFLTPTSQLDWELREQAFEQAVKNGRSKNVLMPRPTPRYLLKELLGWNSINDKFLYVTDGGHYENLGLVELLRRGCTEIYCFDASGGKEQFAALGDAIALARSELAVKICFPDGALKKLKEDKDTGFAEEPCAVGTIEYTRPFKMTGRIVYAPTTMTEDLPWDVLAFKEHDKAFPHHSTLDQLFTDQKFEAYRVLGVNAGESAIAAMKEPHAPANAIVTQAKTPVIEPGNGNGHHDEGWRGRLDRLAGWWMRHRQREAGQPTATP
jgi:patatin-like phospholipase